MALLDYVKTALRTKSTAFDAFEIDPIINACKTDLKLAGVSKIDDKDPIIIRAVTLYAKANFGYSEESEKYQKAYEALKNSLALAGDYNKEP